MRALLLVNRGARKGSEQLAEAVARLEQFGFSLLEADSSDPSRIPDLIRRHLGSVGAVIVGGGDGTLGTAAQGLVGTGCALGVLPMGTANNLARTLGIPADLPAACEIIGERHESRIDVGCVNGKHFLTTASIGMSVTITEELDSEVKRRFGVLAYGMTALRVLSRVRPFTAEIRWEGRTVRTRTVQIVVGNGRYYGSALAVAEDAAIDDQHLDLYSIEFREWWRLLGLLPRLRRGSHGEHAAVLVARARELEIVTRRPHRIDVDGEIGGRTPAHFKVLPEALTVYTPAHRPMVA